MKILCDRISLWNSIFFCSWPLNGLPLCLLSLYFKVILKFFRVFPPLPSEYCQELFISIIHQERKDLVPIPSIFIGFPLSKVYMFPAAVKTNPLENKQWKDTKAPKALISKSKNLKNLYSAQEKVLPSLAYSEFNKLSLMIADIIANFCQQCLNIKTQRKTVGEFPGNPPPPSSQFSPFIVLLWFFFNF